MSAIKEDIKSYHCCYIQETLAFQTACVLSGLPSVSKEIAIIYVLYHRHINSTSIRLFLAAKKCSNFSIGLLDF